MNVRFKNNLNNSILKKEQTGEKERNSHKKRYLIMIFLLLHFTLFHVILFVMSFHVIRLQLDYYYFLYIWFD